MFTFTSYTIAIRKYENCRCRSGNRYIYSQNIYNPFTSNRLICIHSNFQPVYVQQNTVWIMDMMWRHLRKPIHWVVLGCTLIMCGKMNSDWMCTQACIRIWSKNSNVKRGMPQKLIKRNLDIKSTSRQQNMRFFLSNIWTMFVGIINVLISVCWCLY